MDRLAAFTLILLFIPALATPQAKPDFSGTWVLDTEHSSLSTAKSQLPPETLVVEQTGTELRYELRSTGVTTVVGLDGKVTTKNEPGGGTVELQAKWNGDRVMVTTTTSRPSFILYSMFVWSLSADGKVLTLQGTTVDKTTQPMGQTVSDNVTAKLVYQRR
jgi:hypothetical protein